MKKLYFIRHGLSQANVDNVWGGQFESPLTEIGKEQAKKAGHEAKQNGLVFDLIVCSPLSRAKDTAIFIADAVGYPIDKIKVDDRLLERSFGELDGTPVGSYFDTHIYRDVDDVPGAESVEHMQQRAADFLDYLNSLKDTDTILVVGHGAFGRAFKRVIEGKPYLHEYTNPLLQIANAEIHQWIDL